MKPNKRLLIAVAGGIGSGKSEVVSVLKEAGASVIMTDEINRNLLKNSDYLEKLKKLFPYAFNGGFLDKTSLKERIFKDENERKKLNAAAHAEIMKEVASVASNLPFPVFVEIPLIIGSGTRDMFDGIWAVRSPYEERVKRIIIRDGLTKELAESIIDAQKEEEEVFSFADHIINNTGDKKALRAEVLRVYRELLSSDL